MEKKINKNQIILRRLIHQTLLEDINWVYLGETMTKGTKNQKKYVFISFVNLFGDKFLVLELNLYEKKELNKILLYMQNSVTDKKIHIKEIKYSTKVTKLSVDVLTLMNDDNQFDELLKIYSSHKFP